MLLISAAVGKLWLVLSDPFADISARLPLEILWLSIAFDSILGIANLLGRNHFILSFLNLASFTVFLVFNLSRASLGITSCGCSGVLKVPLWLTMLVDIGILCVLLRNRCSSQVAITGMHYLVSWLRNSGEVIGGITTGLVIFVSFVVSLPLLGFGSFREWILENPKIIAKVVYQDKLVLGQQQGIEVDLLNYSDRSAKIVGIQASCTCLRITEEVVTKEIPSQGKFQFTIIATPVESGYFHQRLTLFSDHPDRFRIDVDVVGFVKGES